MIVNSSKYHYKITWGVGGTQWDVVLQKPVELTRKPVTKEIFWRTESSEWVLLRWQNQYVYDKLISILADIEGTTYPIYALVHYHADGITFTKAEYAGTIALDGIQIDKSEGKITFKPKPYDAYTWYDEVKDNKINYKQFKGTSIDQKFLSHSSSLNNPLEKWKFFTHCILLSDIVTWICANCGAWKYTFVSQILTSATNPVTGDANELKETFITLGYLGKTEFSNWDNGISYAADQVVWRELDDYHASFFKCILDNSGGDPYFYPTYWQVYDPIDDDIALEFQISDIFDLLKKLKIYWYIDPYNNYIIFEHYKYFKNGLSYSGTPSVSVDLTDEAIFPLNHHILKDFNGNYFKSIDYGFEEIVSKTTCKYSATIYRELSMQYDSYLTVKNKVNDENVEKFLGEILHFRDPVDYEKVDDLTIMLLNADTTGSYICMPIRITSVRLWVSYETLQHVITWSWVDSSIWNGNCYIQKLFPRYMIYGRELGNAIIDDVQTVLPMTLPYKFQTLRFPRILLESDYYDLPQLIKTEVGDGELISVKIMCDTGWAEIKVGFNYEE